MRITGGKARGIPLTAPKGEGTRPATDRMRESVFSSLGPSIEGARVADLFAGTGSYGLEALSRGAVHCSFYENERAALACLRRNCAAVLKSAGLPEGAARVVAADVRSAAHGGSRFNLIFVDPPYERIEALADGWFENILDPIAAEDARVVFELPGNFDLSLASWTPVRRIGKAGRDKPNALVFERAARPPIS